MAVGAYTDVYTLEAYQERVNSIVDSVSALRGGSFFIEGKRALEQQIEIMKQKEQSIFKKLNVKSIEELNINLNNYRKAVINLSGPALYQSFIGILKEANAFEYETFNKAVEEVVTQDMLNGQAFLEVGKDYAYQKVMQVLNEGIKSSKGINTTFHSTKGFTNEGLFPAKFTQQQKKRWKELFKTKYAGKGFKNVDKFLEIQMNPTSQTSMSATFSWLQETNNLKPTEAKEFFKNQPEKLAQINQRIKQEILNKTNDPGILGLIIDYVLRQDQFAFFVGKNENDIIGILGEIQGIYYLTKFMGNDVQAAIDWRGGLHQGYNNQKPHQDILFEQFGIQVKNSTKEIVDKVNFANSSIEDMLGKIGISEEAKNVFLNYYGTEQFNIEYHLENGIAMPNVDREVPGAEDFLSSRKNLLSLADDIDTLLSLFAATFMYIDIASEVGTIDANTLFLIGGTAFQTASNLLTKVLKDLEAESRHFGIRASLTLDKNIISALNDKTREKQYSDVVIDNIKLTSSYNFHPRF